MKASDYIVHVTEADFDYQVIAYSQQTPVVVDFWADWCIPCKTLDPLLERLAFEAAGGFRLAKLDVDRNQNLSLRFNIRTVPAVKAFKDGRVVNEFSGVLPEPRLREFLLQIAPGKADLMLEKGDSLLQLGQWKNAEATFLEILAANPNLPAGLLGLCRSLLAQGQAADALKLIQKFPASREFPKAELMRPLADALLRARQGAGSSDEEMEAAYTNALRLIFRSNFPAAMDGLLDILRQDKHFRNGEARQVLLALFEVLGEANPITRQYRQELASVLF